MKKQMYLNNSSNFLCNKLNLLQVCLYDIQYLDACIKLKRYFLKTSYLFTFRKFLSSLFHSLMTKENNDFLKQQQQQQQQQQHDFNVGEEFDICYR